MPRSKHIDQPLLNALLDLSIHVDWYKKDGAIIAHCRNQKNGEVLDYPMALLPSTPLTKKLHLLVDSFMQNRSGETLCKIREKISVFV